MIEGAPAITMTLPIQKPGAPDTLLRMRSAPLGMRVMRRRASVHLGAGDGVGIAKPLVFLSKIAHEKFRTFSKARLPPRSGLGGLRIFFHPPLAL
jgi:hypothetical protein